MRVTVINGPNLNLLGIREPDVYGSTTIADLEENIASWAAKLGMEVELVQSNDEAVLVDALHAATDHDGVVLNPGALTHTSRAIAVKPMIPTTFGGVRFRHWLNCCRVGTVPA